MRDYDCLLDLLHTDLNLARSSKPDHYYSDHKPEYVARLALASSFYKKLLPMGDSRDADAAALKKFIAINDSISTVPFEFDARNEAESCFWDYFRDEIYQALDYGPFDQGFDLDFIREHMNVGPGAAQKADSTSMVTKLFQSQLSYTDERIISLYRSALSETGIWCEAEMQRYQRYGFVRVDGCKLFFAPKNSEISRTCGTEANLNMLIQKAIGAFLEQGLKRRFDISLDLQPDLNRELARLGSEQHESTDSFCTADLTSASDCISLSLIQAIEFNRTVKSAILMTRSKSAVLPDGSEIKLNMVSTMGNGFTFPLQTLIFASAVKAVYTLMEIPLHVNGTKNFGVFGDDIIVRKRAYDFLLEMLERLGFQVNRTKSYSTGPFRESCGHDYFSGRNVRGVYIKSLETPQEVVSAINRLNRWSAFHGIMLPLVIAKLHSWLPKRIPLVPPSEADDAGLHVPFTATRPKLSNSYWFKYRCFMRKPKRVMVEEPESCPEGDTSLDELGIGCGFLSGHYRRRDISLKLSDDNELSSPWKHGWEVAVSVRDSIGVRARYQVVTKTIPYWDWVSPAKKGTHPESYGPWRLDVKYTESYSRWEATVTMGLPQ